MDSSFLAAAYSDGSINIFSSMLGDPLYTIKDPEVNYPITSLCWKPTSSLNIDIQSFKAVGADGRILMWRPKYSKNIKTLLVSETNSY